jgi:hypothetical protein
MESSRILFKDSVFMGALRYKLEDIGDGQANLLVYGHTLYPINQSYHLYPVGQRNGMLTKVW